MSRRNQASPIRPASRWRIAANYLLGAAFFLGILFGLYWMLLGAPQ